MRGFLIFLFAMFSLAGFTQSSDESLTTQANVIRNETSPGANTRARIADMYQGLIDSKLSRVGNSGFTQGSLMFFGSSGIPSEDNSNLFWDNANNNLGIGTTSPSVKLHIKTLTDNPHLYLEGKSPRISFFDSLGTQGGNIGISGADISLTRGLFFRATVASGTLGVDDGFHTFRFGGADNKIFFGDTGSRSLIQSGHSLEFRAGEGAGPDATALPLFTIGGTNTFNYQGWNIDSDITPSQIISDQNDYAPSGIESAYTLRLDTDASRTITSINASQLDGRELIIINVGSNDIVFEDASASGTEANRFLMGANLTLTTEQAVKFIYDGTASRWRKLN